MNISSIISPTISQDVLINIFPKYLKFFDLINFKNSNKNLYKNIETYYENKYLKIEKLLIKLIENNDIYGMNIIQKIYSYTKNIIKEEKMYLYLSTRLENSQMFNYLRFNYYNNIIDKYILENAIFHFMVFIGMIKQILHWNYVKK